MAEAKFGWWFRGALLLVAVWTYSVVFGALHPRLAIASGIMVWLLFLDAALMAVKGSGLFLFKPSGLKEGALAVLLWALVLYPVFGLFR
jgi:hypothetical protein